MQRTKKEYLCKKNQMRKLLVIAVSIFTLVACTSKTETTEPKEENPTQISQEQTNPSQEAGCVNDSTGKGLKVLLINGSPRKNGNTYLALMEAAKQLEQNGIASELLQIGTEPAQGCIACNHCKKTGHCVFENELYNRAYNLMSECDGIIVGSPTYYGQPNGTLLCLIQRLCYSASNLMQNKPAAAVAVCRRGGATAVYQTLLMPFQMLNMPIVTSQYWNIVYGRDEGEAALDEEGLQTMRTMANNMAWMLKKIHNDTETPIREKEHKVTNFIK